MTIPEIAYVCHETNRAYCRVLGDDSQKPWEEAPEWQKLSSINGAAFHLAEQSFDPMKSHENWYREKKSQGWKYGPVKDADKKEHPCMLEYKDLPLHQRIKDSLFCALVKSLAPLIEAKPVDAAPEAN